MATAVDNDSFHGFKLSYLNPESPHAPGHFLGPPLKFPSFGEKETPRKDKLNIYLRIKRNRHATAQQGTFQVVDTQTLAARTRKESNSTRADTVNETKYKFSKIFGPDSTQDTLFEDVCMPSLRDFIGGANCLLFAYGATNSGKTYTIQGTPENPGIIPRTLNVLFNTLEGKISRSFKYKPDKVIDVVWLDEKCQCEEEKFKRSILGSGLDRSQCSRLYSSKSTLAQLSEDSLDLRNSTASSTISTLDYTSAAFRDIKKSLNETVVDLHDSGGVVYSVWLSYAEIYNEQIFDLLESTPKGVKRKPLVVGETDIKDAFIKGLHHVCVFSGDEAYQVFQHGQHNLKMAPTNVNHVSSRSHSIFTIKLLKHLDTESPSFATVSTFSLVDLAGAERAKKTNNVGERMKESQSINTSLHVLGKCLEIIRLNQSDSLTRMIPFRESKLTRLFQRALRGQDDLTLIVNVNLDASLHEETINVLKFSALAKELVFETVVQRKNCTLRSSRFSQYINDSLFGRRDNSTLEVKSRNEELLNLVSSLEKEVKELKQKNATIEAETRTELFNKFSSMLAQKESYYQKSMEETENRLEELRDFQIESLQNYYRNKLKRCRCDEDVESDEEERVDVRQSNKILQCKLDSVTEQKVLLKNRTEELQVTNSKLSFELAAMKEELNRANRLVEASKNRSSTDSQEDDALVSELQAQLEELKNSLKKKDEELQASQDLVAEAKKDYLLHMQEHDDDYEKRENLENLLVSKEEDIEDLKCKLELCHAKIQKQAEALELKEDWIEVEKYHAVCEARDEQMFLASKYEKLYKNLEKENEELKEGVARKSLDMTEVRALEAQVASLEDELKTCKEALQQSETKRLELEEALAAVKDRASERESMEEELKVLQKEVKDLLQNKKESMEELAAKSKEVEDLRQELKTVEAGLTLEQNNTKDLQKCLVTENEKLTLHVAALTRELEKKENEYLRLLEDHTILEGMLKNQEAEMETFKSHRDTQFKTYDDMLRLKQDEIEMHKREVHRYQELFAKNLTPNKNEYSSQVNKLKEEVVQLKEELKKYKLEVTDLNRELEIQKFKPRRKEDCHKGGRTTRRAKIQDENDPSLSNEKSVAVFQVPYSESESEEKPKSRRKKLYAPPDQDSPPVLMYPKRGTRTRRVVE